MVDLIQLIQEADFALLDVERTRMGVEAAKTALDLAKTDCDRAKSHFDSVIAKADALGVPRAKLKKIIEERTAVLSASGLLSVPANKSSAQISFGTAKKAPKVKSKKSDDFAEADETKFNDNTDTEEATSQQLDA